MKPALERCIFEDQKYQEAGARLVDDVEEIYSEADVILKVKDPV